MQILWRLILLTALVWGLHQPVSGEFRPGPLLDPVNGLWATARAAIPHQSENFFVDGMTATAHIEIDERGVPHIYAKSELDAVAALGYAVVRDRLFELDFIHRVTTGRLSELLGPAAASIDRHFLENGIVRAVRENTARLPDQLPRDWEVIEWYMKGANTWLSSLDEGSYPLEYRLLGAKPPVELTPEFTMALYAYMTYDLSFRRTASDIQAERLMRSLGDLEYDRLFPRYSTWERTIVPEAEAHWTEEAAGSAASPSPASRSEIAEIPGTASTPASLLDVESGTSESPAQLFASQKGSKLQRELVRTANRLIAPPAAEGFIEGKGSNNWAVSGSRSTTGMPILAGDMHLSLTLPAIWYEAHLITPSSNVYGVTFPAVPGIVEGITPTTAWAFTNTGADQLDTYRVVLDESGRQYLFDGQWRDLTVETDTIFVKGGDPVVLAVSYTHFGPVNRSVDGDYVTRWVGHEFGTSLSAIWDMNRATNYEEFELAIRQWDYPMQNILYAGRDSIVAIRSTGYLPIRGQGDAYGILDGTSSDTEWIGRVPFDELPHSINPERGFLSSTNQRPASEGYPHYLGRDWRSIYRSIRINELLSSKQEHSPVEIASYQADQKAIKAQLFIEPLKDLKDLSSAAERLRERFLQFDGTMSIESTVARLFNAYIDNLEDMTWDEDVFVGTRIPKEIRILELLRDDPQSVWFDRPATSERENGSDVFRLALDDTAADWAKEGFAEVPLGDIQQLQIKHITGAEPLRALWREGIPFGGSPETLSPARSNPVTFTASWRVVVDFSTSPPLARGIYPGGQSGNPFSTLYDAHIERYADFQYYDLDISNQQH
ncbi:MAG: penicillin acylase family protein [Bacteroidetes bacterium]|nr:penicillin acylase family protein [Bacteroidota bacterium]